MNERLIVKSFGPVKELDIVFKSITILIGDQGTGKSCIAKLFSMFKWLEKNWLCNAKRVLIMNHIIGSLRCCANTTD